MCAVENRGQFQGSIVHGNTFMCLPCIQPFNWLICGMKQIRPFSTSPFYRQVTAGGNQFLSRPPSWLSISDPVRQAVSHRLPVVALESTILTHGLPHPQNEQLALQVEETLRSRKVLPATVGLLNGVLKVGLSSEELHLMCSPERKLVKRKVSRHDLAHAIATQCRIGGTTVATTMIGAHLAGVPVFATGGLGGVHRNFSVSHDVSADLTELSQTPVLVVCAGVKSILDIPRTLEVLETLGVCVATLGSDEFPAFFSTKSGKKSPNRVNSCKEMARLFRASMEMPHPRGTVLAVPFRQAVTDGEQNGEDSIEKAIETALQEMEKEGKENQGQGRESTPRLLARVNELSHGASLRRNLDLVLNNVRVAAEVALELSAMSRSSDPVISMAGIKPDAPHHRTVVLGGTNLDTVVDVRDEKFHANLATLNTGSYEGLIRQSCGGVGRNLAEVLSRLNHHYPPTPTAEVTFLSSIRSDFSGKYLLEESAKRHDGIRWDRVRVVPSSESRPCTAAYATFLTRGKEVLFGVNDLEHYSEISPEYVRSNRDIICNSKLLVLDANLPLNTLKEVLDMLHECHKTGVHSPQVWYEPTNVFKATKILQAGAQAKDISFISPNFDELRVLYQVILGKQFPLAQFSLEEEEASVQCIQQHRRQLQDVVPNWIIKLGPRGLLLLTSSEDGAECPRWYDSLVSDSPGAIVPSSRIVNVSGAGDSLVGTMIHFRLLRGASWDVAARAGLIAASRTLQCQDTIAHNLHEGLATDEEVLRLTQGLHVRQCQ